MNALQGSYKIYNFILQQLSELDVHFLVFNVVVSRRASVVCQPVWRSACYPEPTRLRV